MESKKEIKESSERKIKIKKYLLMFILLFIFGASVCYLIKIKYEISKMHPAETQQFMENIYIVKDEHVNFYLIKNDEGYIAIDAGINKARVGEELYKLDVRPEEIHSVFLTHTDSDHVGALELFDKAKVYILAEEEQMIDGTTHRGLFIKNQINTSYQRLKDLEIVTCSNVKVRAIATPGHTPGSMSLLVDEKYLFVGDLLALQDNHAILFNGFFNMDSQNQEISIRKLAVVAGDKAEYIFTGHYGYSNDVKTALENWKIYEMDVDFPLYMQKYNTYVKMENYVATQLAPYIRNYLEAYEKTKKVDVSLLYNMPMDENIIDEVLTYTQIQPDFSQADEEMEKFVGELKNTYDKIKEIMYYYKTRVFEMDGETLSEHSSEEIGHFHQQLGSQLYMLQKSYEAFHNAFASVITETITKNLEKYKSEGHLSNYYVMQCILSAQAIEQYLFEEEITDDTILALNLEDYQYLYEKLKAQYSAYNLYLEDKQAKKERKKYLMVSSDALNLALENLVSAADEIAAKKQSKASEQEPPVTSFKNSLIKVIKEYNQLVTANTH